MTNIEWTDETWNPVTGCTKVSPGCAHCYAETMYERFHGPGTFQTVTCHPERLTKPFTWRKPRKVFVNSMSDLFHEDVPFEFIDRVFAVMALTPQHTYQVLTKRPERMRAYFAEGLQSRTGQRIDYPMGLIEWWTEAISQSRSRLVEETIWNLTIPLPNVWLGTSTENQHWLDIRVPELLATPAAVRFLSCEPLLGPLDFAIPQTHGVLYPLLGECSRYEGPDGDEGPGHIIRTPNRGNMPLEDYLALPPSRIEWVIVGGESGPKARPFDLAWARAIVSQCRAAGVAVFVKQLGAQAYDDGPMCGWPVALDWNHPIGSTYRLKLKSRKGGDMAEWPEDLRVREWPV